MTHPHLLVGGYAATGHFRVDPEDRRAPAKLGLGLHQPSPIEGWLAAMRPTSVFAQLSAQRSRIVVAGTSVAQRSTAQALDAIKRSGLRRARTAEQEPTE